MSIRQNNKGCLHVCFLEKLFVDQSISQDIPSIKNKKYFLERIAKQINPSHSLP